MEEKKKKSGFGTASLVLGIIGVCLSFIPIVNTFSIILGILALIFGAIALCKKSSVVISIIGIILAIVSVVAAVKTKIAVASEISNSINELSSSIESEWNELESNLDEIYVDDKDEILENHLDVTIGEFTVEESDFYDSPKLTVTMTNKGDEEKSFSVHIEAIDKDGNRIDDEYVYANSLGAGQTQSFDIFTLLTSEKIEQMKEAQFRIVEISMT